MCQRYTHIYFLMGNLNQNLYKGTFSRVYHDFNEINVKN